MNIKKITLILGVALLVQGCVDPDETAPTIEVQSIIPAPAAGMVCGEMVDNVITLNSTDTLQITLRLTDDEELSQYKLDIHNNFDCHGHSGKVETTDWYVISIEDVAGTDQTITRDLPVPSDVTTGNYHFHILATDVAGNNAELAIIYSLNVTNVSDTEAPVLSTTIPATSSFIAQKGSSVNFQGSLTDNNPLGAGTNGRLELRYWSTTNQTIVSLYEEDIDNAVAETYNFNFDTDIPSTVADGTYIFELRAFDGVNNPSNIFEYNVEVL